MKEFIIEMLDVLRAPSSRNQPLKVQHPADRVAQAHVEVEEAAQALHFEVAALDALVKEVERQRAARR